MFDAVFFDLDGTLLDSAPDLGGSLNRLLREKDLAPLPLTDLRPYVSGGSPALLKIGFGVTPEDEDFPALKQRFLEIYKQHLNDESVYFPGIAGCLEWLNEQKLAWGVVTNKPQFLTRPLSKKIGLKQLTDIIISGDTFERSKPHPLPLLKAAEQAKVLPEKCLYVGDDERDIIAAKRAGMSSLCVHWGYLANQDPLTWDASFNLESSDQLQSFLEIRMNQIA